ncbi:hypothetical protein BC629DRAFT_1443100 [Irpex lacteus]|nr:hypothetical protein BC629DRAFT_1443100 [Irpex lacteus]
MIIRAWKGCTNTVHLALTALMMNPNCPLHRLSDEERVWMITFMTLLWCDEPDPNVEIGFDVSEQATTTRMDPFHFVFERAPLTDQSASALSVVGMHAYIDDFDLRTIPANFDALVNHARTQPTIRALVLLFDSFERFQNSMKPFVEALDPATEAIEFVCAYEEEKDEEEKDEEEKDEEEKDEEEKGGKKRRELTGRVLGVDMFTLEPTGRIWAEIPNRWGSHKSLEILRRELKRH